MPIKTLPFVGYPVMLALRAMKRQTLLPSLLWSCLVSRLVYLTLTLNTILTNILFPLGKMIGMVRWRISFILSSPSWEIGSPPTVNTGRMKLSCAVPASVIPMTHSYILSKYPPPQCILTVQYILVECNHFAEKKKGCN